MAVTNPFISLTDGAIRYEDRRYRVGVSKNPLRREIKVEEFSPTLLLNTGEPLSRWQWEDPHDDAGRLDGRDVHLLDRRKKMPEIRIEWMKINEQIQRVSWQEYWLCIVPERVVIEWWVKTPHQNDQFLSELPEKKIGVLMGVYWHDGVCANIWQPNGPPLRLNPRKTPDVRIRRVREFIKRTKECPTSRSTSYTDPAH